VKITPAAQSRAAQRLRKIREGWRGIIAPEYPQAMKAALPKLVKLEGRHGFL